MRLELYGPSGLRRFIRNNLHATHTNLLGRYAVHELVTPSDPRTSHSDQYHPNEAHGLDLECGEGGIWRDILPEDSNWAVKVDAGSVKHRSESLESFIYRLLLDL